MRYFVAIFLSLFVSTSSLAEHNQLTPQQISDGWISLFDGETLFGWTPQGDIDWHVENGEIRATKGDVGLLLTNSEFSDYNLHVEFRAEPTTNSGIFARTSPKPAQVNEDCYEVNIAPLDNPFPTGSVVGRHRTDDATVKPLELWDGDWHAYDIVMRGGFLRIYLDGVAVAEFTDPEPEAPRPNRLAAQPRQDCFSQCATTTTIDHVDFQRQRPHRLEHRQGGGERIQSHFRRRATSAQRTRDRSKATGATGISCCSWNASSTAML